MKVLGLLVVLPILVGFTDGAISTWTLDSGSAVAGPNFDFTSASVSQAETGTAGTAFFTVTAAVTGGALSSYTILEPTGKFDIGAVGGGTAGQVTLATNQVLDRETDGASVVIKIQAADDSPASGTATVTLTINDVNDNTPIFSAPTSSPHSVEIADGSSAGAALYTVTATDADATGNTITYSISSGDTNGDFTVATSGAITVATGKTLAKSTTPSYALVIHAVDSGSPADTGSTTLSVTVCDPCSNGTGKHGAGFLSFIIALLMYVRKLM